ncbi:TetR family transcriptional regulator [Actinomadura keratinilytica]|jgi:AcrR family transcriptional regulator|uniref:TetR family transcriptional regulator n=1 Tax=Actinomadura keratinilytica TaxID=547461 RepID=A0ABP7Z949_9ACTN
MTAADPAGGDGTGSARRPDAPARAGLRERKKQRTRMALIDAALDLFLAQGYEQTTIDEIAAAVQVSQRTFFRYFAAKEDVLFGYMSEFDHLLLAELAARPARERPFTALFEALRGLLRAIAEGDPADAGRFRRVLRVVEGTPALAAGQMARFAATEETLAAAIARRQGVDPARDIRPRLLVAFFAGATRVAFEECARQDVWDPAALAARVDEIISVAHDDLPGWI